MEQPSSEELKEWVKNPITKFAFEKISIFRAELLESCVRRNNEGRIEVLDHIFGIDLVTDLLLSFLEEEVKQ